MDCCVFIVIHFYAYYDFFFYFFRALLVIQQHVAQPQAGSPRSGGEKLLKKTRKNLDLMRKLFTQRMFILSGLMVVLFAAFFIRLDWMVRVRGDNYSTRASTRSTMARIRSAPPGYRAVVRQKRSSFSVETSRSPVSTAPGRRTITRYPRS